MKLTPTHRRLTLATAGATTLISLLVGCSDKASEPFNDAPRSEETNDAPAGVITMPDGFSNLAFKCDGPNMVYSAYHGDSSYAALQVVSNDPRCTSAN